MTTTQTCRIIETVGWSVVCPHLCVYFLLFKFLAHLHMSRKGIMPTLQKITRGNQHYLISSIGMLAPDVAEKSAGPAVHHSEEHTCDACASSPLTNACTQLMQTTQVAGPSELQ